MYNYDSLQSSRQRLASNSIPLSNVKFAFCGFRTKNKTFSEACSGHPIKEANLLDTIEFRFGSVFVFKK